MIAKALEYFKGLVDKTQFCNVIPIEIDGETARLYIQSPGGALRLMEKPRLTHKYSTETLSGLASLLTSEFDVALFGGGSGWSIHVTSPTMVAVVSSMSRTNDGERDFAAIAEIKHDHFQFNKYMPQEQFIIGMLASFQRTEDWQNVMALVGNLRGEKVRTDEDDGFSQLATVKQGTKMAPVEVKNPVTLRPFRTFYDVEQPWGQYVVRLQQKDDELPQVALFEVRDGRWQHEAMQSIKEYFVEHCPGYLVVC